MPGVLLFFALVGYFVLIVCVVGLGAVAGFISGFRVSLRNSLLFGGLITYFSIAANQAKSAYEPDALSYIFIFPVIPSLVIILGIAYGYYLCMKTRKRQSLPQDVKLMKRVFILGGLLFVGVLLLLLLMIAEMFIGY